MTARKLTELLPGRTPQAIGNMRLRHCPQPLASVRAQPAVREPGDYVETLSAYLVDEWECLEIWLRWNGYSHHKELGRDRLGWVTLLCTAK